MINSSEFLVQARDLLAKPNAKEVDHRSAISRAYYSLFHSAFEILASKYKTKLVNAIKNAFLNQGIPYDTSKIEAFDRKYFSENNVNIHRVITDTLLSIRSNPAKDAANDFKISRKKRNQADYDISGNYDLTKTVTEIDEIERIIRSIERL